MVLLGILQDLSLAQSAIPLFGLFHQWLSYHSPYHELLLSARCPQNFPPVQKCNTELRGSMLARLVTPLSQSDQIRNEDENITPHGLESHQLAIQNPLVFGAGASLCWHSTFGILPARKNAS